MRGGRGGGEGEERGRRGEGEEEERGRRGDGARWLGLSGGGKGGEGASWRGVVRVREKNGGGVHYSTHIQSSIFRLCIDT